MRYIIAIKYILYKFISLFLTVFLRAISAIDLIVCSIAISFVGTVPTLNLYYIYPEKMR